MQEKECRRSPRCILNTSQVWVVVSVFSTLRYFVKKCPDWTHFSYRVQQKIHADPSLTEYHLVRSTRPFWVQITHYAPLPQGQHLSLSSSSSSSSYSISCDQATSSGRRTCICGHVCAHVGRGTRVCCEQQPRFCDLFSLLLIKPVDARKREREGERERGRERERGIPRCWNKPGMKTSGIPTETS